MTALAHHPFGPYQAHQSTKLRILSLGAGVQSTTLALMAAHGVIGPMPDYAIFADTGAEPAAVYEHLKWLRGGNVLPFPVHVIKKGEMKADLAEKYDPNSPKRFTSVPFFLESGGMGRRQCTKEYKVEPLMHEMRRLAGYRPRQRIPAATVEVWIGISTDELGRVRSAYDAKWQWNRWPLIEQRMDRAACLAWLKRHGYPEPPKSACSFCPYHSNALWRELRAHHPEAWAEAVEVDTMMRANGPTRGMKNLEYVHRSLKPLAEANLNEPDPRQGGFLDECEGMCGL